MSIFDTKHRVSKRDSQVAQITDRLSSILSANKVGAKALADSIFSMEALSDDSRNSLETTQSTVCLAIEQIEQDLRLSKTFTSAQKDAAVAAAIMGGNIREALRQPAMRAGISTESISYVQPFGITDSFEKRSYSAEAYDDRDNQQSMIYSVTYNLQAARQDEFGETLFPTVVVTPDNVGLTIIVRLMNVLNEFQRDVSGALNQYNKKNILRAFADATILKNESTRIVPVARAGNAANLANFVNPAWIPPAAVMLENQSITTAPLAVGKKFSLLGISQTDTMLANGLMDVTDSIEPAIKLQTFYVHVPAGVGVGMVADTIRFSVQHLPMTTFTPQAQGNTKIMQLTFDTTSVVMSALTKQADGTAISTLGAIATNGYKVRLAVNMSGSVNIETADTVVYGNSLSVASIEDNTGKLLDLTVGAAAALVAAIGTATIIGYELEAWRSNLNRRQRGQMIEQTHYRQVHSVPMRSPLVALHPVTNDGQDDSGELVSLITATHISTSNAAVTALIQASVQMAEWVDARDAQGEAPEVLGAGRFLVRPTYLVDAIDMATAVDSLTATQRFDDMRATIINKIRDMVYRMYSTSEYKAASDSRAGGIGPRPTVIVATDQVLGAYLFVSGDTRVLGNEFDLKVVTTMDTRMHGHLFITFGDFSGDVNAGPNPLHFGTMAWKPEMTVVLPISRGGQISKELSVQPSYLHIVNLPILAHLVITNVPNVLVKVPRYTHAV